MKGADYAAKLSVPNDFAVFYKDWYDNTLSKDAKAKKAFDEKETITIVLNTSSMTVKAATKDDSAKDLLDLSVVESTNKTHKLVNVVLTDEFKAETALIIYSGTNQNAYAITLPENEKSFDLEMQLPEATATVQSAGVTKIGILTPKVTYYKYDDLTYKKGLILGEGLDIDALNPVNGSVYLDGAAVEAFAFVPGVTPTNNGTSNWDYDKDGNLVSIRNYKSFYPDASHNGGIELYSTGYAYYAENKVDKVSDYQQCYVYDVDGNYAYVNTLKVFKGNGATARVNLSSNLYNPALENLVIEKDADVYLSGLYVANIEGKDKEKSLLTFTTNTPTGLIEKVSNVTITNKYYGYMYMKAENIEGCIIQPTTYCYPEAGTIKNNIFTSYVYVVPATQSAEIPTYSQTFEGCTFLSGTRVSLDSGFADDAYVLDGEGNPVEKTYYYYMKLIPETTPVEVPDVDEDGNQKTDEDGNPMTKIEYQETGNLVWSGWYWTDNASAIPDEAKAMDPNGTGKYWYAETKYAIYPSNNRPIKDYIVTIVLNDCKVKNGNTTSDVTKDSNIFSTFASSTYGDDEQVRYTINGVTYKPVQVSYKGQSGTISYYTALVAVAE